MKTTPTPPCAPDAYGFAPTDAPLTFGMGADPEGGLIVRAVHGGKLGLTHIRRLASAPELLAALELIAARETLPNMAGSAPKFDRRQCSEIAREAIAKARG